MRLKRPDPDQVFTPRSSEVNSEMYIQRGELELALRRAVAGSKNIIISGESGSGKTWLYKRFFSENDVHYELVNLASASLHGGLKEALQNKVDRQGQETKTQKTRSNNLKVQPAGIGVHADSSITSTYGQPSAFERLLAHIREQAGAKDAVLVYDNFEQVIERPEIIKAISDTIILLDDDDLSRFKVKICIVGVPTDIQRYLSRSSPSLTTLANRLTEIPEVARMSKDEASTLAANGFHRLGYKLAVGNRMVGLSIPLWDRAQIAIGGNKLITVGDNELKKFYDDICWKTDRIAQHIHEYCLAIAHEAERNYFVVNDHVMRTAEKVWMARTLTADYVAIESRMNARDLRTGRRNQVLYCLGKCKSMDFDCADIEQLVRNEFPTSTSHKGLKVASHLSELSSGELPLIRRTPKGDAYRFTSPKYRMCLRTMFRKGDDEGLEKVRLEG